MKKRLISTLLTIAMAFTPVWVWALDIRAIPTDSYFTPYYEAGNPYVTHYAPWLRNLHLMSAEEAASLKASGGVGGEANQQVRMLEISPVNSNIMYFMTNTSGIYATKDGGKHWYNTTGNMRGSIFRGLWCDISDEKIVYASLCNDGFYRSIDGGESWELILEDLEKRSVIRSNTITQDSSGNTYFAASSGIYRLDKATNELTLLYDSSNITDESTVTIEAKPNISPLWRDIEVSSDGKTIYAAAGANDDSNATPGLYISRDSGATWSAATIGGSTECDMYSVALHPENGNIYVLAYKDSEIHLYDSKDNGETFTDIWNLNKIACGLRFGPKDSSGVYPLYLCAYAKSSPYYFSTNYTDYGTKWGVLPYNNVSFTQFYDGSASEGTIRGNASGYLFQQIAPDMTEPGRIVFGCAGIVEGNNNGGSWTFNRISGGFSGASVPYVTFNSDNVPFFAVTDRGSYVADGAYTKNAGGSTSYPTFKGGVDDYFTMAEFNPNDKNHIVAALGWSNGSREEKGEDISEEVTVSDSYTIAIRQSTDGGESFSDAIENTKISAKDYDNYNGDNTVIRFDGDNIYTSYFTSRDGGATWTRNVDQSGNKIFIYAVSKSNPKLMVGTTSLEYDSSGNHNKTTKLCVSSDGGETWNELSNLKIDRTAYTALNVNSDFDSVEFDINGEECRDDDGWIWMVEETRVYHINIFTGEGTLITSSANKPSTGLVADYFKVIAQNPNSPNHILLGTNPQKTAVGTDNKLSESYDGGLTWHTVPGLWSSSITSITFVPDTTEVFVGTMGGIMIYDCEKYNYYAGVQLTAEGQEKWLTLPRINAAGANVNNGEYITAPENPFTFNEKVFKSWKYNGNSYLPGELIPLA